MCLNPHREGKRNLHLYLQHQNHHTVLQNSISMLKQREEQKPYKAIIQNLCTKQSNNNWAPFKSYTNNWC